MQTNESAIPKNKLECQQNDVWLNQGVSRLFERSGFLFTFKLNIVKYSI